MRISIVGNCQAAGLASCLSTMNPSLSVSLATTSASVDLRKLCDGSDRVLVQAPRSSIPEDLLDVVIPWPRIIYAAFHPDAMYVKKDGKTFGSVLGQYHSALALLAWMNELSVPETLRLFRSEVYERVGYFRQSAWSERSLLAEGEETGWSLEEPLASWKRRGCFMHSPNHPHLFALADIARSALARMNVDTVVRHPERFLPDALARSLVYPVYPEIGNHLGVEGDYLFKLPISDHAGVSHVEVLDLESMVVRYFAALERVERSAIECPRFASPTWRDLATDLRDLVARPAKSKLEHPYRGLPNHQFWKQGVAESSPDAIDPVVEAPFAIAARDPVATAGSCFAQHIARSLSENGFNHALFEPAPSGLSESEIAAGHWGTFSARYGNVYTARQLVQLLDRAEGRFEPVDAAWQRPDGRWIDPFRPQIERDGWASADEVVRARRGHLAAVRRMFRDVRVFVFTLGLTEAWRSTRDGAVFPLSPGVVAGGLDPDDFEFVNFSVREVLADLETFHEAVRALNPAIKLVLTVSPVPLVATYEPRHVLVSNTASKSILRTAADEFSKGKSDVWYFPSYELVVGAHRTSSAFGPDRRTVSDSVVARIMALFLRHASPNSVREPASEDARSVPSELESETKALFEVLCDEEKLARE